MSGNTPVVGGIKGMRWMQSKLGGTRCNFYQFDFYQVDRAHVCLVQVCLATPVQCLPGMQESVPHDTLTLAHYQSQLEAAIDGAHVGHAWGTKSGLQAKELESFTPSTHL